MSNSNTGLAGYLLTHLVTEKAVEMTHMSMHMYAGKFLSFREAYEEQRTPGLS